MFGTLGVQGKIRPRKGREEEGVRSGNYEKERGRRKTEEREGEVVEVQDVSRDLKIGRMVPAVVLIFNSRLALKSQ